MTCGFLMIRTADFSVKCGGRKDMQMEATNELISDLMKKLAAALTEHRTDKGQYDFDLVRVAAALDFAIKEVENTAKR